MLLLLCVGAQFCQILWNPMDCSPPSSSVHWILQARIQEWLSFHSPIPNSGLNLNLLCLLHWQADTFPVHHLRSPNYWIKPIKSSNLLFCFVLFCLTYCSAPRGITHILFPVVTIRSDQMSRSVVSNSLRPHESQHIRPPCPSSTPGVHSDSCPSSQWCHPAISSSVVPFSSCPQSLPASESFPMSQLFT